MPNTLNEFSNDPADSSEPPLSREALVARAATRPNLLAANTISHFNQVLGKVDLMEMAGELNTQISRVQKGDLGSAEETLVSISVENFPPVSVEKFPHGCVG